MFPGAVDDSGATLDDVLKSIELLSPTKIGVQKR